ncbi:hypothetical protein LPJ81_006158, partial [Coemansia sp. IMI 209127]
MFSESAAKREEQWPSAGKIEFCNFSMKYREDLELVLKDVNLTINPGEKIGIVGRTGAGKTSLTRALFRLIDTKTCSGSIVVDDQDIFSLNIGDLRPKIGIIPQEPTMFEGIFRQNLDPLPRLEKPVTGWVRPHGLSRHAGNSFSDGQQQIFGLCRLLMRNRKIVVLDEATANVDLETDQRMQELIRSEFEDCTVLTIAHRLETIMNSDRIIVMDSGRIAEIGSPT